MNREEIITTVLRCLRVICKMKGITDTQSFDESTLLIGSEAAILDSLGAVMLLVQVEEALNALYEKQTALVQRLLTDDLESETVGTLADRVLLIMGDPQ